MQGLGTLRRCLLTRGMFNDPPDPTLSQDEHLVMNTSPILWACNSAKPCNCQCKNTNWSAEVYILQKSGVAKQTKVARV